MFERHSSLQNKYFRSAPPPGERTPAPFRRQSGAKTLWMVSFDPPFLGDHEVLRRKNGRPSGLKPCTLVRWGQWYSQLVQVPQSVLGLGGACGLSEPIYQPHSTRPTRCFLGVRFCWGPHSMQKSWSTKAVLCRNQKGVSMAI